MRSAGSPTVPVWLALPVVLLIGVGAYAAITHVVAASTAGDAVIAGDQADHGGASSDASSHDHGDRTAGQGHEDADPGDRGHGGDGHEVPAADRPRALVLGGFAAINGAVLVSAAVLRHRGGYRRRSGARRQ